MMMRLHENNLSSVPIISPSGDECGRLYFIPADVGYFRRFTDAQERLKSLFEPLAGCDITPDGCGADTQSEAVICEAEQQFAELLNNVLGVDAAAEAMQQHRAFAEMTDGSLWAESIMDALQEIVKSISANIHEIERGYISEEKRHGRRTFGRKRR